MGLEKALRFLCQNQDHTQALTVSREAGKDAVWQWGEKRSGQAQREAGAWRAVGPRFQWSARGEVREDLDLKPWVHNNLWLPISIRPVYITVSVFGFPQDCASLFILQESIHHLSTLEGINLPFPLKSPDPDPQIIREKPVPREMPTHLPDITSGSSNLPDLKQSSRFFSHYSVSLQLSLVKYHP